MITDDGFDITILPDFLGYHQVRVKKIVKYAETQLLRTEEVDNDLILETVIEEMKQRIEEKIDGNS